MSFGCFLFFLKSSPAFLIHVAFHQLERTPRLGLASQRIPAATRGLEADMEKERRNNKLTWAWPCPPATTPSPVAVRRPSRSASPPLPFPSPSIRPLLRVRWGVRISCCPALYGKQDESDRRWDVEATAERPSSAIPLRPILLPESALPHPPPHPQWGNRTIHLSFSRAYFVERIVRTPLAGPNLGCLPFLLRWDRYPCGSWMLTFLEWFSCRNRLLWICSGCSHPELYVCSEPAFVFVAAASLHTASELTNLVPLVYSLGKWWWQTVHCFRLR
jgi:hypothetical protein